VGSLLPPQAEGSIVSFRSELSALSSQGTCNLEDLNQLRSTALCAFVKKLDALEILPLDSSSLQSLLHEHGLNCCSLGELHQTVKSLHIRQLVLCDAVARSVKLLWRRTMRREMRKAATQQTLEDHTVDLFNGVLSGDVKLWAQLQMRLKDHFSFNKLVPEADLHRPTLLLALVHHCGAVLDVPQRSIHSAGAPGVHRTDLVALLPRTKVVSYSSRQPAATAEVAAQGRVSDLGVETWLAWVDQEQLLCPGALSEASFSQESIAMQRLLALAGADGDARVSCDAGGHCLSSALQGLARSYLAMGKTKEAETTCLRGMLLHRGQTVASTLTFAALRLAAIQAREDAHKWHDVLARAVERWLGPAHPLLIEAHRTLADLLCRSDDAASALVPLSHCLHLCQTAVGTIHTATTSCQILLGHVYSRLGRTQMAADQYERASIGISSLLANVGDMTSPTSDQLAIAFECLLATRLQLGDRTGAADAAKRIFNLRKAMGAPEEVTRAAAECHIVAAEEAELWADGMGSVAWLLSTPCEKSRTALIAVAAAAIRMRLRPALRQLPPNAKHQLVRQWKSASNSLDSDSCLKHALQVARLRLTCTPEDAITFAAELAWLVDTAPIGGDAEDEEEWLPVLAAWAIVGAGEPLPVAISDRGLIIPVGLSPDEGWQESEENVTNLIVQESVADDGPSIFGRVHRRRESEETDITTLCDHDEALLNFGLQQSDGKSKEVSITSAEDQHKPLKLHENAWWQPGTKKDNNEPLHLGLSPLDRKPQPDEADDPDITVKVEIEGLPAGLCPIRGSPSETVDVKHDAISNGASLSSTPSFGALTSSPDLLLGPPPARRPRARPRGISPRGVASTARPLVQRIREPSTSEEQ